MTELGKGLDTAKANIAGARDGSSRREDGRQMPITPDLESGDGAAFFDRVADDVDWTVMGARQCQTGSGSSKRRAAPYGASDRQRRSGSGRASLLREGQKRNALRRSVLLGRVFPGRGDCTRSRLPKLCHGYPIVPGESDPRHRVSQLKIEH